MRGLFDSVYAFSLGWGRHRMVRHGHRCGVHEVGEGRHVVAKLATRIGHLSLHVGDALVFGCSPRLRGLHDLLGLFGLIGGLSSPSGHDRKFGPARGGRDAPTPLRGRQSLRRGRCALSRDLSTEDGHLLLQAWRRERRQGPRQAGAAASSSWMRSGVVA